MRRIARTIVGVSGFVAIALSGAAGAKPRLTGEERLAQMIEGRVAGAPVDCLTRSESRDVEVIDKTALVYGSGRTIYVNRTSQPDNLDSDDILVARQHSSRICKMDVINLRDSMSRTYHGFVSLAEFVPYRRVSTPGQ